MSPAEGLAGAPRSSCTSRTTVKEFAEDWKIKSVITRLFGLQCRIPIKVGGEVVNRQKPIWVEPKSQVTDEQYRQFYQHLTHHSDEKPLWHLHFSADSPIQFNAILYCPPTNVGDCSVSAVKSMA